MLLQLVTGYNLQLSRARQELDSCLCSCSNDSSHCWCDAAGLAAVVGKVFLPSITSDSVQQAVAADPEKFVVSKKGGIIATEEILEHVEDHIGTFMLR